MKRILLIIIALFPFYLAFSQDNAIRADLDEIQLIEQIKTSVDTVSDHTINPELFGQHLDWTALAVGLIALFVSILSLCYQAKIDKNTRKVPAKMILEVLTEKIVKSYYSILAYIINYADKNSTDHLRDHMLLCQRIFAEDISLNLSPEYYHFQTRINLQLREYNTLIEELQRLISAEDVDKTSIMSLGQKIKKLPRAILFDVCEGLSDADGKTSMKDAVSICLSSIERMFDNMSGLSIKDKDSKGYKEAKELYALFESQLSANEKESFNKLTFSDFFVNVKTIDCGKQFSNILEHEIYIYRYLSESNKM